MKIWFIVYVGTQIGGSIGPVPYDMEECLVRASEKNAEFQKQVATGRDLKGNSVTETARNMHFGCVEAERRPQITFEGGK